MSSVRRLLILLSVFILFSVTPAFATTFDFHGLTKYTNDTAMNNTNVTIAIYAMIPGQGPTLNDSFSALSNESGNFNVTDIPVYQNLFYKPVIRKYNSTNTAFVDYIGASLPEFPQIEVAGVSPVTFYLKNATSINISAINPVL